MTHYRKGHRIRRRPTLAEEMEGTDELFGHDDIIAGMREFDNPSQLSDVNTTRELRPDSMAATMQQRGVG